MAWHFFKIVRRTTIENSPATLSLFRTLKHETTIFDLTKYGFYDDLRVAIGGLWKNPQMCSFWLPDLLTYWT